MEKGGYAGSINELQLAPQDVPHTRPRTQLRNRAPQRPSGLKLNHRGPSSPAAQSACGLILSKKCEFKKDNKVLGSDHGEYAKTH